MIMRRFAPIAATLPILATMSPCFAQANDPAQAPVAALDDGLLAIMKMGKAAGAAGRMAAIGPVVDRAFDMPLMTRLAVGSAWNTMSAGDQSALVAAFRRMTVAQYAANFDSFAGEKFTITPRVDERGGDRLVQTILRPSRGEPVSIGYRLRQNGGEWKIIDVFYKNSISQLATKRADFAAIIRTGGAKALIAHLNRASGASGS